MIGIGPIPACAGQPAPRDAPHLFHKAYPRVCGATITSGTTMGWSEGLSPRVRGNHRKSATADVGIGPIPACAGQPGHGTVHCPAPRAYPRVCGATCRLLAAFYGFRGLSPRVRGNHEPRADKRSASGPIPACAGQPLTRRGTPITRTAYPRVCGATGRKSQTGLSLLGLSPRVRGNLLIELLFCGFDGPIPACAGQPFIAWGGEAQRGAYPRVCGATFQCRRSGWFLLGLSPRVRGNLLYLTH